MLLLTYIFYIGHFQFWTLYVNILYKITLDICVVVRQGILITSYYFILEQVLCLLTRKKGRFNLPTGFTKCFFQNCFRSCETFLTSITRLLGKITQTFPRRCLISQRRKRVLMNYRIPTPNDNFFYLRFSRLQF